MNNKLFWKISLVFLLIIIAIGSIYIYLAAFTSRTYFEEANQKLNSSIAEHTVKEVTPLVNGEVDTNAIQEIMHSMMVINPSVEVYLLDTKGNIITYVAPYKKVKLTKVSMGPITSFVEGKTKQIIKGDDPRNPGQLKVFSAAAIKENDQTTGYVYIILASEEQTSVLSTLLSSYVLKLGTKTFLISLSFALVLGILAFLYLTRNLRKVIHTVSRFKEGDMTARVKADGDFYELGETFNAMADKIVNNINELKSVEKLRRELIANVSHDLRTPLSVIRGYIETLVMKDDLSQEDKERYLSIVHDSSENLSKLIEQLFEYSKLEAQEISPEKEPFQLTDLIHDIIMKFKVIAENKGVEIDLDTPKDLPMVFADIGLVERAISNLLDNALKYGHEGGKVVIRLGDSDSENAVAITISDDGPGIPASEQSYIFERYKRFDRSKSNRKGAGLGLAIVKKILEIHNQRIKVFSEAGKGASFMFALPAYQA